MRRQRRKDTQKEVRAQWGWRKPVEDWRKEKEEKWRDRAEGEERGRAERGGETSG